MTFLADRRATERSGGDQIMRALCLAAGLLAALVLIEIAYQVISGAQPAISKFGLGFLGHIDWAPNLSRFGAGVMLYGTARPRPWAWGARWASRSRCCQWWDRAL